MKHFEQLLPAYYPQSEADSTYFASLPRAYREAMTMLKPQLADSVTLASYREYEQLMDSLSDNKIIQTNISRRHFGNTYWWYYDH